MKVENSKIVINNRFMTFKQMPVSKVSNVTTLKHVNIGSCADGCIGKIVALKGDNSECFLNVFKKQIWDGYENYSIKNEQDEIVGEINLIPKIFEIFYKSSYSGDPNHVFVSELRNYSNPNTPYYRKGLEQYKIIGIRLLQIAQKRSEEALCNGNIKLISKNESKPWYKNVIGMVEEFPPEQDSSFRIYVNNPNSMILPPSAKEHLRELQGGL